MALLFMDGFDHYQTADLLKKWSGGTASINNTGGRRGGGCAAPYGSYLKKTFPANETTVFVGAALYIDVGTLSSTETIFTFGNPASGLLTVGLNSDGSISARNNHTAAYLGTSAPSLFSVRAWFYLEVQVVCATSISPTPNGAVAIRVNGITALNLTNVDTSGLAGTPTTNLYSWLQIGTSTVLIRVDDFYLLDSSGTTNNTFLGDCRVDAYYPSSEGTTVTTPVAGVEQWTPTPAGSHWPCVSTQYPVATPTTYVTDGGVIGNTDEYGITDMANTPLAVFGVQVCVLAKTSDAGSATLATGLVIENAGASSGRYYDPNISITNTPLYALSAWDLNPATNAAWAKADVNAALVSLKRAS